MIPKKNASSFRGVVPHLKISSVANASLLETNWKDEWENSPMERVRCIWSPGRRNHSVVRSKRVSLLLPQAYSRGLRLIFVTRYPSSSSGPRVLRIQTNKRCPNFEPSSWKFHNNHQSEHRVSWISPPENVF